MQTISCSKARNFLAAAIALIATLGFAAPAFARDAILNPDGKLTYLDVNTATASGINDTGQVTGDIVGHGFVTGPNGVGTLSRFDGYPTGINDAGQVVGYSFTESSEYIFITGANGVGMTDLGTLGGANSYASDINDAGQVAGVSRTADGSQHAFITGPNGVGMTDLGTLGGIDSFAYGINDAGQVVGYSFTVKDDYSSYHAFITGPNGVGMTDLNSLVVNPAGGTFIETANGINNHGQVIVTVAGVPEPETYALLLAGLALIGFTARLRKAA